ncbi:MAG: TIGR03067 domain-containing protein, partial [bacterium]|nr:TIGR03067 domain-containing protein [bacterium]
MMKFKFTILLSIFVCMLTASTLAGKDAKKEMEKINGTWVPVSATLNGQPLPGEGWKTLELTIDNGTYTVKMGGTIDKGTVKLHLDQKYVGVDITGTEGPNKGVTMLAISKATKDTMTVCYNNT